MTERIGELSKIYLERKGFFDELKVLREEKHMTIRQIARLYKLSESTVRAYMRDLKIV